jgi:hypothetical protein
MTKAALIRSARAKKREVDAAFDAIAQKSASDVLLQ